jgi:hypothetical protein
MALKSVSPSQQPATAATVTVPPEALTVERGGTEDRERLGGEQISRLHARLEEADELVMHLRPLLKVLRAMTAGEPVADLEQAEAYTFATLAQNLVDQFAGADGEPPAAATLTVTLPDGEPTR